MANRQAPPLPTPPTEKTAKLLVGFGVGIGAVWWFTAGGWLGPALGLAFAAWGVRIFRVGRAAQRTHAAFQALTRGLIDEAEVHLDAIPPRLAKRGSVLRAVAYQRALIAFYRGDAAGAARTVDGAIRRRTNLLTYSHEQMQRSLALSLRALACASMGETNQVRADVAEVIASPYATPEALSRAHLADAVALARSSGASGGSDALATHMRAHGAFMLEHALPRERVLARALRTMVRSRTRSIYREPAKPDAETDRDAVGSWVASIAPEAAAFHEASRLVERATIAELPAPTDEAKRAVAQARASAKGTVPRRFPLVLGLWVALILMFLTIWQFLTPAQTSHVPHARPLPPPPPPSDFTTTPLFTIAVVGALFALILTYQIRRARGLERELFAAVRAFASNDATAGLARLDRLDRGPALIPAQSLFQRARHFEEKSRFADAVALCDRALASINAQPHGLRTVAAQWLTPSVLGLRATALAALGREAEANAELATIATQHAAFGHRAVSELRVRLISAVRRGELEAARSIARERTPDLPIPLRDETLADLVLATAPHGASRDEQERVASEIRDDATTATWIAAIAPALRDDLDRRVAGPVRIASDDADAHADDDGDVESDVARRA